VIRAFDDAALTSEYGSVLWTPGSHDELRMHASHFAIDRGLPGPATIDGFGASLVDTRQADDQFFSSADYTRLDSNSAYGITGSYQHQFESYTRPATNTYDSARTSILSGAARWQSAMSVMRVFAGLGYSRSALTGTTNALANGDNSVSRDRTSAYVAASSPVFGAELTAALRAERVSGIAGLQFLPQASVTVPLWRDLSLHAAYGRAFHPPTFNELYWSSEGGIPNPNLRPERAESWSAMLHTPIDFAGITGEIGATYFHTSVIDEILWLSSGSSTSTPYNLGPVVTSGAEVHVSARMSVVGLAVSVDESYTLADARVHDRQYDGREVPYSSPSSSLLVAEISREGIGGISLGAYYIGHRYTDPANSEESKLAPVTTFDLAYEAPIFGVQRLALVPRFSVSNVTDVQHSEFPGYPLPGRTYTLTISLSY
jgi:vitamin B12 transporter